MKLSDYVQMAIDSDRVGRRIVILKTSFPRIDIPLLFIKRPRTFLQDEDDLLESAQQLKHLLSEADDMDNIVSVLPEMTNIEHAVSILVTLRRLLPNDDPVQMLN